jgi:hypothetical protein
MRTIGLALLFSTLGSWAQATVTIDTRPAGDPASAYVFVSSFRGEKAAGTNYFAQLYAGPQGTQESALLPTGAVASFRTGIGAGFIDCRTGCVRVVESVLPGKRVEAQLRVWSSVGGATFEAAWNSAQMDTNTLIGKSRILSVTTSTDTNFPAVLRGLESFLLIPAPVEFQIKPSVAGVELSWPGYASNWDLEVQSNLLSTNWTKVFEPAMLQAGRWTFTAGLSSANQFFRLRRAE